MSLIKRLFGLDVASHLERAEQYERAGKLGMAQLELERALEIAGPARSRSSGNRSTREWMRWLQNSTRMLKHGPLKR